MSVRVSMSWLVISACSGLMYSGVPIELAAARVKIVFSVRRCWVTCLGDAEVNHLWAAGSPSLTQPRPGYVTLV